MIENPVIEFVVNISLIILIALLPLVSYRIWVGKNPADRLLAVDLITTLLVGIVVLLALVEGSDTTIDIGIALAALSFAGTVSIARFISEGRVF